MRFFLRFAGIQILAGFLGLSFAKADLERVYSGACTSQGAYTNRAFSHAKEVYETLEKLKNDPACKNGISRLSESVESAYKELQQYQDPNNAEKSGAPNSSSMASIPGEINSLYGYISQNKETSSNMTKVAQKGLASKVIELMTQKVSAMNGNLSVLGHTLPIEDWSSMKTRLRRTAFSGLSYLDTAFQIIPEMKLCVAERPDEMLTVIGAGIGMLGAFSGTDSAGTAKLANTLLRFVGFMREMKFTSVQANLKKIEYWNSVSCLLETTTQAYCSNKDARRIHKLFADEGIDKTLAKKHTSEKSDSPLFGYYLMQRELPTISYWIQQIQMGTDPKQTVETNLRNKTIETLTTLIKSIFTAKGYFNEKMIYYQDISDPRSKMNFMVELVNGISNQLMMGGGDINFFTQVINQQYLPYYLIGLDSIPAEVLPSKGNNLTIPKSFDVWALGEGGQMQPIFHQPDRLSATIRQRLWNVLDQSLVLGSRYFRRFFNPDTAFLATAAGVDPSLTVYQSILNIESYLVHLHKKFSQDPNRHGLVLPAIADTIDRFNRVRVSFYKVKQQAKEIAKLDSDNLQTGIARLSKEEKRKWEYAYADLLTRTYTEFNILLQRDTFIANRLSTFVLYDFSERINRQESMEPYLQDLLRVAGRNLHDRLFDFVGTNPTAVYQDVNNAATILKETLGGYESFFSKEFYTMISFYHNKAQNNQDTPERAYDQTRARLCIQTLSFDNWKKYRTLCDGAVLYSQPNQEYFDQVQSKKTESNGITGFLKSWFVARNETSKVDGEKLAKSSETIDLRYDELVQLRLKNDSSNNPVRDSQVCLMDHFYRQSEVYWLTRKFDKTDESDLGEIARVEEETLAKERELEKQLVEQELAKEKESQKAEAQKVETQKTETSLLLVPEVQIQPTDTLGLDLQNIGKILFGPLKPVKP